MLMAPVHLYLAAWVLGGVLLGASMLLDAREPDAAEDTSNADDKSAEGRLRPEPAGAVSPALPGGLLAKERGLMARCLRVFPLGLIGFGLSGLLAKGLDLDLWPWTFVIALSIGVALTALGYRLSRTRAIQPAVQR
jgi:hypothetical protein